MHGSWRACRSNEDFDGPYFEPDEDAPPYPFTSIRSAEGTIVAAHDLCVIKDEHALLLAAAPDLLNACQYLLEALITGDYEIQAIHYAALAIAKARGAIQ